MPAYIDTRGYIRVTFPGFDRTLTNWRGQRIKDLPTEDKQTLCNHFNQCILMGNFAAVKTWFPGERAKTLVKKLVYTWLDSKPRAASTYKTYTRIINKVLLPRLGDKAIQEVARQDFYFIREGWGDTFQAKQIRAMIQSLLTWAWREGLTDKQIFVPAVTVPGKPTPYIELKDRWGIQGLMRKPYNKSAILSIEMGLRVGEIVALQRDCVDRDNKLLRIIRHMSYCSIVPMRKGGDEYSPPYDMPYSQTAKELLETLKPSQAVPWLFHGIRGRHLWPDQMSREFKRAAREYGLPQVCLHWCRHSFIKDRVAEGYSLEEAQALVGHSSRRTTERYKGPGIRHIRRLGVMGGRE